MRARRHLYRHRVTPIPSIPAIGILVEGCDMDIACIALFAVLWLLLAGMAKGCAKLAGDPS